MNGGRPVVIVGAGLAGLAAAVELSLAGTRVCVLEQKQHGGGRAYSFTDAATGETIDNGQHALIAGYTSTLRFLDRIGTRSRLHRQEHPSLTFHHPVRGRRRFVLPPLPAPFHLAAGILSTGLFAPADRLRLLKAGLALRSIDERDPALGRETVAAWLARQGQGPELLRSFWEPLAIAVMNERTERASALLFARCLRRAFLESTTHATLLLPSVGLSELFVHPACALITARGGSLRLGARVTGLTLEGGAAEGVVLADGSRLAASAVILAVPSWALETLLPGSFPGRDILVRASALPVSPILSLHLWYPDDFMEDDALGLIGRTVQWVFNRRKIEERIAGGGHLSTVISAAHEQIGLSNDELAGIVTGDLREVFGEAASRPARTVVIREKRATFSPHPDAESLRPPHATAVPNLFLAGDWTATGLPGTIEGAVWSGHRCAELVQARQLHL